jgi:hypothetical protein
MSLLYSFLLRRGLMPAAVACGLAACSTHPLPEDFSRASTVDIVKSIRCEARAGLLNLTAEEWRKAQPIIAATMIGYDFVFHITETNNVGGGKADKQTGLEGSFLTLQRGGAFSLELTGSAGVERANERRFKIIEPL